MESRLKSRVGISNPSVRFTPQVSTYPYRAWTDRSKAAAFNTLASLLISLGFVSMVSRIITILVTEKEMRIKEGVKIMGMHASVWWVR